MQNHKKKLNKGPKNSPLCFLGFLLKVGVTALVALMGLLPINLKGQVFKADTGYAEVKGGNSMTSYTGKSRQLQGKIDMNQGSVQFKLPLKTLETGNSVRDNHMLNTLEADKYPQTKFSGEVIGDFPQPGQTQKVMVKGDYTIHGVSKSINVKGSVKYKEKRLHVKATFPVKITEYGMEPPGFWFAEVRDKHIITVRITLKRVSS